MAKRTLNRGAELLLDVEEIRGADTSAPNFIVHSNEVKTPRHQDTKIPRHQDTKIPRHQDTKTPRHQDTKTPRHQDATALTLRLPNDIHQQLRAQAYQEKQSMTSIILEALKNHLETPS